jgi:glutamate-ammonia-ligase adenylyltransferase
VYVSLAETSAAADASVAAALSIAGAPAGFAVLALGRLGTREFDLLSDADLLFLRDESLDVATAQQTAQQVVQVLSSYTREGTIFSVDARLRPRGGEGELVVTPAQLEKYFRDEAQPWEALTFTKLRHIAGSEQVSSRALAGLSVLRERFASDRGFVVAGLAMRARIESASAPKFALPEAHSYDRSLKSGPGGVYDTDFLVGTLLVKHGIPEAEGGRVPPIRGNLRDRLCALERRGLLSVEDSRLLQNATEFLRAVDHAIRLATGRKSLLASEAIHRSTAELASRFLGGQVDQDVFQRLAEVRMGLRTAFERLMERLRTS